MSSFDDLSVIQKFKDQMQIDCTNGDGEDDEDEVDDESDDDFQLDEGKEGEDEVEDNNETEDNDSDRDSKCETATPPCPSAAPTKSQLSSVNLGPRTDQGQLTTSSYQLARDNVVEVMLKKQPVSLLEPTKILNKRKF